jgi:hypothetical protein
VKIASNSYLLHLIKSHPEGIKEYDLLKQLSEQNNQQLALFDTLVLFQQHFLLFHALYHLCDQQHQDQQGHIIIEALNIQWLPYSHFVQDSLTHTDPLRSYYLDLNNLEQTSAVDVDNLLESFWSRINEDTDKGAALALFDLAEDCDLVTVKRRYRQLLLNHHPDKGGSVAMTQSLNEAMAVLKACYT